MRVNLFFLHGFLGRPGDWTAVRKYLPDQENVRIFTPDYFNERLLTPQHNFQEWSRNFIKWVEDKVAHYDLNILVGYSMGGRLALHALESKPSLWQKVILISTNSGFNDQNVDFDPRSEERRSRWIHDSYWAEEFIKAPWDTLITNWNAQPVFSGGLDEPTRQEKDYSRDLLSLALTQWSVAQQKNMRPLLQKWIQKIIWMVGEKDQKYLKSSTELQGHLPGLRVELVQEAAHRVPFDNPKYLGERLHQLVQQCF
ncbi:MAG: alpha/beta fold hydrolase [Bdellovibrio sp.]